MDAFWVADAFRTRKGFPVANPLNRFAKIGVTANVSSFRPPTSLSDLPYGPERTPGPG